LIVEEEAVPEPAGGMQRKVVTVLHDAVEQAVAPNLTLAVRSVWPKFTPVSVVATSPSPEVGTLTLSVAVWTGASKVIAVLNVPTSSATAT